MGAEQSRVDLDRGKKRPGPDSGSASRSGRLLTGDEQDLGASDFALSGKKRPGQTGGVPNQPLALFQGDTDAPLAAPGAPTSRAGASLEPPVAPPAPPPPNALLEEAPLEEALEAAAGVPEMLAPAYPATSARALPGSCRAAPPVAYRELDELPAREPPEEEMPDAPAPPPRRRDPDVDHLVQLEGKDYADDDDGDARAPDAWRAVLGVAGAGGLRAAPAPGVNSEAPVVDPVDRSPDLPAAGPDLPAAVAAPSPEFLAAATFPETVYGIVNRYSDAPEGEAIVSWCKNGFAFNVRDRTRFCEEVLPVYFSHNKFESFQRQLRNYGIHCIMRGAWKGAYEHACFRRGEPQLLKRITLRGRDASAANTPTTTAPPEPAPAELGVAHGLAPPLEEAPLEEALEAAAEDERLSAGQAFALLKAAEDGDERVAERLVAQKTASPIYPAGPRTVLVDKSAAAAPSAATGRVKVKFGGHSRPQWSRDDAGLGVASQSLGQSRDNALQLQGKLFILVRRRVVDGQPPPDNDFEVSGVRIVQFWDKATPPPPVAPPPPAPVYAPPPAPAPEPYDDAPPEPYDDAPPEPYDDAPAPPYDSAPPAPAPSDPRLAARAQQSATPTLTPTAAPTPSALQLDCLAKAVQDLSLLQRNIEASRSPREALPITAQAQALMLHLPKFYSDQRIRDMLASANDFAATFEPPDNARTADVDAKVATYWAAEAARRWADFDVDEAHSSLRRVELRREDLLNAETACAAAAAGAVADAAAAVERRELVASRRDPAAAGPALERFFAERAASAPQRQRAAEALRRLSRGRAIATGFPVPALAALAALLDEKGYELVTGDALSEVGDDTQLVVAHPGIDRLLNHKCLLAGARARLGQKIVVVGPDELEDFPAFSASAAATSSLDEPSLFVPSDTRGAVSDFAHLTYCSCTDADCQLLHGCRGAKHHGTDDYWLPRSAFDAKLDGTGTRNPSCRCCVRDSKAVRTQRNRELVIESRTMKLGYVDCSPVARRTRRLAHAAFALDEIAAARRLVGDPTRRVFVMVYVVSTTTKRGLRTVIMEGNWNGSIKYGCIYLYDAVTGERRSFTEKEMSQLTVTLPDGSEVPQPEGKLVMNCLGEFGLPTDTEHELQCDLDRHAFYVDDAVVPLWSGYHPSCMGYAPWHVGFRVLIGDADGNPPGSRDRFRAYVKDGLDDKLARRIELYADV